MKNNFINKAIRLILGAISILPRKKIKERKSNRNTRATADLSTAITQSDKNLKSEATRTDSSKKNLKTRETISAIPTETAKEAKSEEQIPKKATLKDPKDSVEAETSPEEKQKFIKKETKENNIDRSDAIEKKSPTAKAIPLSSLGLSVHLFNRLRASNIRTVDNLVTKTSEELLRIKGINKFGVIEIEASLNKLNLDLKDSPSVDLKVNEPAPPRAEHQEENIETKALSLAETPEIIEVIPKNLEIDEQQLIQKIETRLEEYLLNPNKAEALLSDFQEIIPKDRRWNYAQRCLHYILGSTQSFFDLYGRKYGRDRAKTINISIALITRKKVDAFIKNPKNSHLMRAVESHCKPQEINGFHYVLRSLAGETIYEIGSTSPRKQNSHMVRQKLTLASRVLLIDKKGFQRDLERAIKIPINKKVNDFFADRNRLPIQGDNYDELAEKAVFEQVKKLSLRERLLKLEELNLPISKEEYDYHYDAILSNTHEIGIGYWLELENIAQFLRRHAEKIGEPTLMPKQVQLPHSVRGAVTRFGGQSFVASKVGLIYQGQLVGEDGKTFWTKEKLDDLFDTIRSLKDESKSWIPSVEDIKRFLKYTDLEEYKNLKFESLMTAIERENIALIKVENDNLDEIEVSGETTERPITEDIPARNIKSETISTQNNAFMIDDKRANELKELDDEVRGRLNKIFSTPESDSETTNYGESAEKASSAQNSQPGNLKLDASAIEAILISLRDNQINDYVNLKTLETLASELNLTTSLVFDYLNEIALNQTDSLLLEEEDEENYYIDVDVLNSLLTSLTS